MGSGMVLIVEDDPAIRDTLAEVLEDEGLQVATAVNGRDALDFLADTHNPRPDLILLDIMMPILDGFAFRQAQLKEPNLAQIPTVLLSADCALAKSAQRAQIDEYMQKPVDLDALIRLTEKYCTS